ncbi:MAG: molybdopterin containing oxidoreductase, partial [Gammaproteobacteria bacterium]|nr:molybdopterin containing oxidoreductase [Gammaproteobacteria bacterium]
MMKKIGIHKLYSQNSTEADRLLWGRETDPVSRRGFLRNVGLISMSTVLGGVIPFAKYMPQGLIPAALAQSDTSFEIPGKEGLVILNDRPINAETPA